MDGKIGIIIIFSVLTLLLISFTSSISSSIIYYMSMDNISSNCEDGLSGDWVYLDECSSVITDDNCPENSVVNQHEKNFEEPIDNQDNQNSFSPFGSSSNSSNSSIEDFFKLLLSNENDLKKLVRCLDCSDGLMGDWVPSACSSVITDDTCPEHSTRQIHEDDDLIRCYDCSPALSGDWVDKNKCSSIFTSHNNCPENSFVNTHEDDNLIRCYDCSRGLEGDWVDKNTCNSVITNSNCPPGKPRDVHEDGHLIRCEH